MRVPLSRWLLTLALGGVAAGSVASGAGPDAARALPDVILITVDTLRSDRLGSYGHEAAHTQHIDAIAARGVRFSQATVSLPRTTPALASLLTGLEPRHHHVREVGMKLGEVERLQDFLGAAGYETLGFSASRMAGPKQLFEKGFDEFRVVRKARSLTKAAIERIREVPQDRPLFLWAHYFDPHFPYLPPPAVQGRTTAPACRSLMRRVKRKELTLGEVYVNREGWAEAALEDCKLLYDAEIAHTSRMIGKLLNALDEAGRLDAAHVIFTSDHGEHLGERDFYYEHGPTVHDADIRVPLLWSGPGVARGRVDDGLVQLEDVVPSLLGLLGVEAEPRLRFDGRDLGPRLRGVVERDPNYEYAFAESASALRPNMVTFLSTGRQRNHCIHVAPYSLCRAGEAEPLLFDHTQDPYWETDIARQHPEVTKRMREIMERWPAETARELSVRGRRFKLVRFPRAEGGYRTELYDLKADPGERKDVGAEHPEELAKLQSALDAWSKGLPTFEAAEPDEDLLEAMRSLGYVQ
jgi:arylsulfatase A-like enzyme